MNYGCPNIFATNEYDVRGRLTSTIDPNLIEVSYDYDHNNNLTELTDGENHTRTWTYNSRNLVTEKQYPGNAADNLEYVYDGLRRLSIKIDQLDDTVYHIYDLAGRLIEKEYRTGGSVVESTDTFTYDAASRLLTTSKGRYAVTTAHTWNADSTPASESFTADGRTYTSSRTYDAGNRPLTHSYPDGNATTWGYDARNLVTSVSYQAKSIVNQAFDDGYRLTGQTLGNGLTRTIAYTRDDNMRTADTTFDGAALDDLDFSYSYAIDKQVSAETIATDLVPDASFTASYDDGNRVTGWDRPGAPGTIRNTQSWSYDDAGNWDSTTVDGTAENRSHTTADQISLIAGQVAVNDIKGNLTAFTYDKPSPIGNINTDYILEWDLDNRLKKARVDNDEAEYRYDALGRRVLRKEGTNETALIWWGDSENAEYQHAPGTGQACIQNDIFAHPSALNTVIARAVAGDENDLQWYHKNYLDHVYAVSDDTGDVIEHYRYSAFGEIEIFDELGARIASTQIANTITWNTRRQDSLTGFYLYKYRHYSPQLGRWPSRDPIEEEGGINVYSFCYNSPWSWVDRLGREPTVPPSSGSALDGVGHWADIASRVRADVQDSRIAVRDLLSADPRVPNANRGAAKYDEPVSAPRNTASAVAGAAGILGETFSNGSRQLGQGEGERKCGESVPYDLAGAYRNCCCCVIIAHYRIQPNTGWKVLTGEVHAHIAPGSCDKNESDDAKNGTIRRADPPGFFDWFHRKIGLNRQNNLKAHTIYVPWGCK